VKPDTTQTFPPRLIGLLVVLTLAWGFNWPLIKIALAGMAPMHFRTLCLLTGAVGLFAIAMAGNVEWRVPRNRWGQLAAISFFNLSGWNILAVYGVAMMASGRAAILGYTMPVWGVLLSRWLLNESFTPRRALGLVLGMSGMGLLLAAEFRSMQHAPLGALCMIGAAVSWAIGVVLIRKWGMGMPPTAFTAWQMVLGVIPILAIALVAEEGSFNLFALSPGPLAGVLYNMFVAFIFCYWAWTKIVQSMPVGVSSLAMSLVPVVGVFSGAVVLGEAPRLADYAALVLIVGALATVLVAPRPAS
jgi:drug/metabolite transporter (DMT)-like permease